MTDINTTALLSLLSNMLTEVVDARLDARGNTALMGEAVRNQLEGLIDARIAAATGADIDPAPISERILNSERLRAVVADTVRNHLGRDDEFMSAMDTAAESAAETAVDDMFSGRTMNERMQGMISKKAEAFIDGDTAFHTRLKRLVYECQEQADGILKETLISALKGENFEVIFRRE